jgi:hypothetical protein
VVIDAKYVKRLYDTHWSGVRKYFQIRRLADGGQAVDQVWLSAPGVKEQRAHFAATTSRGSAVAMIFNPDTAPLIASHFSPSFEAAARSLKVEPIAAPVHSDAEIETVMTSLGGEPRGGLVVMPEGYG